MKGGTNCGAGGGAPILKSNIIVTTEEDELVGLDVVLSLDGSTVQTKTFTDSKQVVFTVKVAGNYDLTCGEATASVNVSTLGIDYTAELALSQKVTIDVYGGAMETITMVSDDGTSTTLTTDASGKTVATVEIEKSYTFSGGVSGYAKNVTIVDNRAVYIMPEGTLYWYGNECVDITGGFEQDSYSVNINGEVTKTTNSIELSGGDTSKIISSSVTSSNAIDVTNYSALNVEFSEIPAINNSDLWLQIFAGKTKPLNGSTTYYSYENVNSIGVHRLSLSAISGNIYPHVIFTAIKIVQDKKAIIKRIWLE